MPNHKPRLVSAVRPLLEGTQLTSLKTRPNQPCVCGSGKKQKKCCGSDTTFWAPKEKGQQPPAKPVQKMPEPNKEIYQHIYISLKHTHKKDKWFTMWRENSAGYSFILENTGTYDEKIKNEDEISVPVAVAVMFFTEVEYEGRKVHVLPNTAESRKAFGFTLASLKAYRAYKF